MEVQEIKGEFNASGEKAPLTLDKAVEIFDLLADMQDIAFGYKRDGCYARAHIMCRRLVEMGLSASKAWAFEGKKSLRFVSPEGNKTHWCYHVAAALSVQMPGGGIQDVVLDPSLFDGPVSLKEWGDIMAASPEKLQIVPFGIAPQGWKHDYQPTVLEISTAPERDAEAACTMANYLWWQDGTQRIVFPSQYREQVLSAQNIQGRMQGTTWISAKVVPAEKLAQSYLEAKP